MYSCGILLRRHRALGLGTETSMPSVVSRTSRPKLPGPSRTLCYSRRPQRRCRIMYKDCLKAVQRGVNFHLPPETLKIFPFRMSTVILGCHEKCLPPRPSFVFDGSSPTGSPPQLPAPPSDGGGAASLPAAPLVVSSSCFPAYSSCILRSRPFFYRSVPFIPINSPWGALRRSSASAVSRLSSSRTAPCFDTWIVRSQYETNQPSFSKPKGSRTPLRSPALKVETVEKSEDGVGLEKETARRAATAETPELTRRSIR